MQPTHYEAKTGLNSSPSDRVGEQLFLPASIGLAEMEALQAELISRIATDAALIIDAGHVDRASTPCIQLLVAAATAAQANGLQCKIINIPDAFSRAIKDLGLCGVLGMAVA